MPGALQQHTLGHMARSSMLSSVCRRGGGGLVSWSTIFLRIHYAQWLHPRPVVTAQEKPYMLPDREYTSSTVICCSASAGAVMLSGETANGKHPALVVKTMAAIVANAELAVDYQEQYHVIRWVDHSQGLWSFHHAHPLSRTRPLLPRPPPTHPPTPPPLLACAELPVDYQEEYRVIRYKGVPQLTLLV